jgi:hypothetical protein
MLISGNQYYGSAGLDISVSAATSQITYTFQDVNVTCGAFRAGNANAAGSGGSLLINYGNGLYTVTSFVGNQYNGTASQTENFQSCTLSCSGNLTFGSNHTVTSGSSIVRVVPGAGATATVTSNNKGFNIFRVVGNATGTVALADPLDCAKLTDSTGIFNSAGKTIWADTLEIYSAQATTLSNSKCIYYNKTTGASASITQTSTIDTALGGTITTNGIAQPNIYIRGKTTMPVFTADEYLWIDGGDTLAVTGDATFNNTGDSVAMAGTGTGVIQVGGNFSTAAAVKWDMQKIRVIMTGAGSTITLNGNDVIPILQANASTYINVGGNSLVGGLIFGNDNISVTVRAGDTLVLAALANADWSGSAGNLDSLYSATAGSRFYVSWSGSPTITYAYFRDMCFSPGTLNCPWTSGCRSGGGNRCP